MIGILLVGLAVLLALVWVVVRGFGFLKQRSVASSPFDRLVRMTGDGDAAERLVRFEVGRAPELSRKEAARRACDRLAYERSR